MKMMHNLCPVYTEQNYLDCDLDCKLDRYLDPNQEDAPVYTGHSLFNTTKCVPLLFIVQSLLYHNIWITIIQIVIQIDCL